jgi:hypothetical protein
MFVERENGMCQMLGRACEGSKELAVGLPPPRHSLLIPRGSRPPGPQVGGLPPPKPLKCGGLPLSRPDLGLRKGVKPSQAYLHLTLGFEGDLGKPGPSLSTLAFGLERVSYQAQTYPHLNLDLGP